MRRDLGDGLILRTVQSTEDIDKLAETQRVVFAEDDQPAVQIAAWTYDMLSGHHPTIAWDDAFVVEDTSNGQIVSSLILIPQTWFFDGVPFGVGRPEIVCTLQEYRRRGLVRAQFEAMHQRCADLHLPVQGITGIDYYYRQFGYEYALRLGGGTGITFGFLPQKTPESRFELREWTEADLPQIMALYDQHRTDKLITVERSETYWRYILTQLQVDNSNRRWLRVIVEDDHVIGYILLNQRLYNQNRVQGIDQLVLTGPIFQIIPWLLPALRDEIVSFQTEHNPLRMYFHELWEDDPLVPYLTQYRPYHTEPYAWYMRVPDLIGFLNSMLDLFRRRLADNPAALPAKTVYLDLY
ncbi:MAG: GNAT family N-acetyltransferase, partial [Chloroflexi bacterium]|nr:GNAT family N-acetyltransferase [Chloroflexota bacterium]